jgi:hypothetical protein
MVQWYLEDFDTIDDVTLQPIVSGVNELEMKESKLMTDFVRKE